MSEKDITDIWMHIGTDNKEINFKSNKGRVKSGAKGIGRFALDRLGQKYTLYTKLINHYQLKKYSKI